MTELTEKFTHDSQCYFKLDHSRVDMVIVPNKSRCSSTIPRNELTYTDPHHSYEVTDPPVTVAGECVDMEGMSFANTPQACIRETSCFLVWSLCLVFCLLLWTLRDQLVCGTCCKL